MQVGAFRFTGKSKKVLLWDIHMLLGGKVKPRNDSELFILEPQNYTLPELMNTSFEDDYHELELLGFPITLYMFDLLKTQYRGDLRTNGLIQYLGQTVKMVGLYVCEKTVLTTRSSNIRDFNFFIIGYPSNTPQGAVRICGADGNI